MRDPVGTVEKILGHFGIPFTTESRQQVQASVDDHPKTKHGVHRYQAADFGLDEDRLRERFAFYIDRFGVEPERKERA